VTGQGTHIVHYCPHCQAAVKPADLVRDLGGGRSGHIHACPQCWTPTQAWPADLPLPTLPNVRAMWAALNNLRTPLPRGRFRPRSNRRGVWN